MSQFPRLSKKVITVVVVLLLFLSLGGGLVWMERTALRSWYYVRNLVKADDRSQALWAERVAGLGEDAVPSLLDYLIDADPTICQNVRAALARLSQQWGIGDSRTVALAMRCGRDFNRFSAAGQQNVLELAAEWFRSANADTPPGSGLLPACVRFLMEASTSSDPDTQDRALELCSMLLAQPQGTEALSAGRDLVRHCFSSDTANNRLKAVQLAKHPGMDLFEQMAVLLRDPAVEVRRAALGAESLEAAKNAVLDDTLLPLLHDDDLVVRHLCVAALEKRGLTSEQIRLGFLITSPNPTVRIQIVEYLNQISAPNPAIPNPALWLTRLSHDSSPAIRAAAARAMSRSCQTDRSLAERLDEMARTDPSATVCLLAKYYLVSSLALPEG